MHKFQYPGIVLMISIGVSHANGEKILLLDCISPVPSKEQIAMHQWNRRILSVDGLKTQKLKVGLMASLACPALSNVEIC